MTDAISNVTAVDYRTLINNTPFITIKYIMFWKDRDCNYKGDILVYDTITKKEEIYDKNSIFQKFPVPPPFSMCGNPFGHYNHYNVTIITDLDSYHTEKQKYMNANVKESIAVIGEKGLFTTKCYKKGETVHTLEGEIQSVPSRESIHIGDGRHICDQYGKYVNHSFQPTVWVNGVHLVAIRDLDADEEITFNYNDSEIEMACPFSVDGILVCGANHK